MDDGPDILNFINLLTLFKISGFMMTLIIGIPIFILLLILISTKVIIQTLDEEAFNKKIN